MKGINGLIADYSELEKDVQLGDSYAIGYLALVHAHGEKEVTFPFPMP